jgi:ATP-dependent RNA helicase RhlE
MFSNNSNNKNSPRGGGKSFGSSRSRFGGVKSGQSGQGGRGGSRPFGRSGGRPAFKGKFGGSRSKGGRGFGQYIDASKFINKAVITEEVEVFVPVNKFVDFQIDERLKKNITDKGYKLPTPIQDKSIPHVLQGQDVVGIANTGTGKTAAFLIPVIDKILKNPEEKALVIVPTRELALQIEQEFIGFVRGFGMYSVCAVGGANINPQMSLLRRKHNIVIGTPGRLKDLMERRCLDLSKFKTIVLDEADRMLDMGFVNDMRFMMSKMPAERHTLFFSATLSTDIEKLINDFLKSPVRISVKTRDTSKNIDQDVVRVTPGKNKIDLLHDLLNQNEFNKVLIFGRTKHGVERLSKTLLERGFKAESIHGDKNHAKRQKALALFKNNHIKILVATDVAARGLDIPNVSHVINFDVPGTYEDYVHRIGRTGRGDKSGKALTFIE